MLDARTLCRKLSFL